MRDETAFLAAMAAAPEDDLLRLAFADWLEERGDDARAEFIRCQVGMDKRRAEELLAANREEWERPFRALGAEVLFHRGLPWLLKIDLTKLVESPEVLGFAPEWLLLLERMDDSYPRAFDRLALAPHADRIHALDFACGIAPDELRSVLVPRVVKRLRSLRFGEGDAPALLATTLAVPGLRLARLAVEGDRGEPLGDAGCWVIAQANRLATLNGLELRRNWISDEGAAALAESPNLHGIADLDLRFNDITDAGLVALTKPGRFPVLRSLDVSLNEFGPASVVELASSPLLARLVRLSIWGNPIGDEGAIALAESPASANLRELVVSECEIGYRGFVRLLESPHLAGVSRFSTPGNDLSPDQVAELKACFGGRVE